MADPLVGQAELEQHIRGRKFFPLHRLPGAQQCEGDWVTIGILYFKQPPKVHFAANSLFLYSEDIVVGHILLNYHRRRLYLKTWTLHTDIG